MEKKTTVHVQRWESLGGGKVRVKIADKINLTNITHDGVPYITTKSLGRGRFVVRRDPKWVAPTPEPVVPEGMVRMRRGALENSNSREPMEYEEEVNP